MSFSVQSQWRRSVIDFHDSVSSSALVRKGLLAWLTSQVLKNCSEIYQVSVSLTFLTTVVNCLLVTSFHLRHCVSEEIYWNISCFQEDFSEHAVFAETDRMFYFFISFFFFIDVHVKQKSQNAKQKNLNLFEKKSSNPGWDIASKTAGRGIWNFLPEEKKKNVLSGQTLGIFSNLEGVDLQHSRTPKSRPSRTKNKFGATSRSVRQTFVQMARDIINVLHSWQIGREHPSRRKITM